VIKPVVILVRKVTAVNCRITTIAWFRRTSGWVLVCDHVDFWAWISRSAELILVARDGGGASSSTDVVSCSMFRSQVAKEAKDGNQTVEVLQPYKVVFLRRDFCDGNIDLPHKSLR